MAGHDQEFMKGLEYGQVRVNKDDDLFWIKNVVDGLCYDGKVNSGEYINLITSLESVEQ